MKGARSLLAPVSAPTGGLLQLFLLPSFLFPPPLYQLCIPDPLFPVVASLFLASLLTRATTALSVRLPCRTVGSSRSELTKFRCLVHSLPSPGVWPVEHGEQGWEHGGVISRE